VGYRVGVTKYTSCGSSSLGGNLSKSRALKKYNILCLIWWLLLYVQSNTLRWSGRYEPSIFK